MVVVLKEILSDDDDEEALPLHLRKKQSTQAAAVPASAPVLETHSGKKGRIRRAPTVIEEDAGADNEIEVVHRRKGQNGGRGSAPGRGRGRGANGVGRQWTRSTKPIPSLTLAAFQGKLPDVRRLLQERADVNELVGKRVRTSPLMAASVNGSVAAVAELLVAGADPNLKSREGMYAGDLTSKNKNGDVIGRLLKTFSKELEAQLNKATTSEKSPEEIHSEAMAVMKTNALKLVEKAVRGKKKSDKPDENLEGSAAKEARKRRQQQKERVQKRKEDKQRRKEDERLKRVAAKAANRRGKEEETEAMRLRRVQWRAAARRRRLAFRAEQQRKEALREEKKRAKRRARGESSRSTSRPRKKHRPSRSRERGDGQHGPTVMCPACGQTGETLRCGLCNDFGVCGMCSTCYLCQRASGWCANPTVATLPGMAGASGKPEMCGMSHPSEAFPHLYEKPGKDRKKKDNAINLDESDSDDESGEGQDAGEEEAEEEEQVSSSEEEDPGEEETESSSSSSSSSDDEQDGAVKEEDDIKKEEEESDDELKVKEEVGFG